MDFAQVETKFKELKEKYDTGAITEEEFKAQLEKLMIQDQEGKWWMIGYETGQWYYHDGENWVRGEPRQVAERRLVELPSVGAMPSPPINRLAIAAVVSVIAGLMIGPAIAGIAGLVIGPVIGSVLALIFGYKARNDIRQRPGETSGERLAMASIVMGWICLVLLMLVSCGIIAYILIEALGGLKY